MKKNLVLFLVCILMGGYAYYSQEYKEIEFERQSLLPEWDLGSLASLQTKNLSIEVKENGYWIPSLDAPADPYTSRYVLEMLDQLRVVKRLTNEEVEKVGVSTFFPESDELKFVFQDGNQKKTVRLRIGTKLNYSRGFYGAIAIDESWKYYILKDHSALEGVYSEADHKKSNAQYLKFVGLLHLDQNFFLPQSHAFFLKGVEQFEVKSNVAKPYVLNLKDNSITPKIFKSVNIDADKIQAYINDLAKTKVSKVLPISQEKIDEFFKEHQNFENLKGELVLRYSNQQELKLKYYESGNEIVVYNEKWKFAQTYERNQFALFLPHHQDFYKKEPFEKVSGTDTISDSFMEYLRTKANWLTKIDKIDAQFLKKQISSFQAGGKTFSLFELNKDLVLVDVKENIKYHYYQGMQELKKLQKRSSK